MYCLIGWLVASTIFALQSLPNRRKCHVKLQVLSTQRYVAVVLIPVVLIRVVDSAPDSDIADDQSQGSDSSSFLSSFLRVRWSVVRGSVDEDADEHVGVGAKSKSKSTGEEERGRGRGR